ncbi:uncharacterized protein ACNS7B_003442 [Menidia menidia]
MSGRRSQLEGRLDDLLSRIAMETQEIKELEQQLTDGQILANEALQRDLEGVITRLQRYLRGLRQQVASDPGVSQSLGPGSYMIQVLDRAHATAVTLFQVLARAHIPAVFQVLSRPQAPAVTMFQVLARAHVPAATALDSQLQVERLQAENQQLQLRLEDTQRHCRQLEDRARVQDQARMVTKEELDRVRCSVHVVLQVAGDHQNQNQNQDQDQDHDQIPELKAHQNQDLAQKAWLEEEKKKLKEEKKNLLEEKKKKRLEEEKKKKKLEEEKKKLEEEKKKLELQIQELREALRRHRSLLVLCEDLVCLERTLLRRRSELRQADRLLLEAQRIRARTQTLPVGSRTSRMHPDHQNWA